MSRLLPILATALLAQCLAALPVQAGTPDPARLQAHMSFLADDLLEGRETGTRGYDIAAQYVAAQFRQLGLKPAGDPGSFLQRVPLKGGTVVPNAAVLELQRPAGTEALVSLRDFLMGPRLSADRAEVTAPLVFVGHGVTAPRFGHDDYAGIDVRGKIAVWISGRPRHLPSEEGAHYASGLTKARLAAQHGAVGFIELQTPEGEKRNPFARSVLFNGRQAIDWVTAEGRGSREVPGMLGSAFVNTKAAARLFTEVPVQLDELYAAAEQGRPLPRMDLKLSARLAQATQRTELSSANVVGLIESSDPVLRNEYLVFTAHLDGLGVQPSFAGDTILNGAMDNASGAAHGARRRRGGQREPGHAEPADRLQGSDGLRRRALQPAGRGGARGYSHRRGAVARRPARARDLRPIRPLQLRARRRAIDLRDHGHGLFQPE